MKKSKLILTKPLIDAVNNTSFTRIQKNKAFELIDIILSDPETRYEFLEDKYKGLSQQYMRKVFNSRYDEWFDILCRNNIVQAYQRWDRDTYTPGKAKIYRINPELLEGQLETIELNTPQLVTTFLTENASGAMVVNDFKELNINTVSLTQAMNTYIERITVGSLRTNCSIKAKSIKVYDSKYKDEKWISTEKAIEKANKGGKTLIQGNGRCYIMNIDEYIDRKRRQVRFSYLWMIKSLDEENYYTKRNQTNNRLDTNYTNISTELLRIIKEENDLVELDVHNCQFALICSLYREMGEPETDNFLFYEYYARRGLLYEFIKLKLELSTRQEAKNLMFELCFSSRRFHSLGKKALSSHFSDVMEFISEFKKNHGDKGFPISLQLLESKVFIDKVFDKIKTQQYFCITRHDSLLVRRKDALFIYYIMREELDKADFRCAIDCDWDKENAWSEDYERSINGSYQVA